MASRPDSPASAETGHSASVCSSSVNVCCTGEFLPGKRNAFCRASRASHVSMLRLAQKKMFQEGPSSWLSSVTVVMALLCPGTSRPLGAGRAGAGLASHSHPVLEPLALRSASPPDLVLSSLA